MHQIRFRLGLCPNPLGECSPDPAAGFKGPTSKERGRMGRKGGEEGERKGEILCSSKNSPE